MIRLFLFLPCIVFSSTIYIFLGPPGVGKGTQAFLLKDELHIPHISVGDLFREQIKQKTDLGNHAQEYINRGELVPTQLALDMLFERLKLPDCDHGCILDGSSRTLEQAKALVAIGSDLIAILFDLHDQQILSRIEGRSICSSCQAPYSRQEGTCSLCGAALVRREDDRKEIAEQRLKTYRINAVEVNRFYEELGVLIRIDAAPAKEDIFRALVEITTGNSSE